MQGRNNSRAINEALSGAHCALLCTIQRWCFYRKLDIARLQFSSNLCISNLYQIFLRGNSRFMALTPSYIKSFFFCHPSGHVVE